MSGNKLKNLRFDLGKTQSELATELKVSQAYYSAVERGVKPFTVKLKRAIQEKFNLTEKQLIKYSQEFDVIDRIKQLRRISGMTQSEVARFLKVSNSYYADIECKIRTLSKNNALKLSELYGVSFETIYYGIDAIYDINRQSKQIAEELEIFKQQLSDDPNVSDHDYRVMVQTIDKVKELLKDF